MHTRIHIVMHLSIAENRHPTFLSCLFRSLLFWTNIGIVRRFFRQDAPTLALNNIYMFAARKSRVERSFHTEA
jgi:hypothetical protein